MNNQIPVVIAIFAVFFSGYYLLNTDGGTNAVGYTTFVPQAEIETTLTIIDIYSYPTVGGNWTVRFNTTGTANLTIRALDGTTWNNINETEDL
ncbi:MAG: hypothetical protein KAJ24_02070, partial [Candidatus Aenigmarchaeota archaeon]|nr:hypothetical protein [Candidatus Aenigmarchaeota archaeon]